MAKLVARITVVTLEPGHQESKVIYKSKKKKAKLSRWLKPVERWQRRSLEAQQAYSGELLSRHKKSNRKFDQQLHENFLSPMRMRAL